MSSRTMPVALLSFKHVKKNSNNKIIKKNILDLVSMEIFIWSPF